MSLMMNTSWNPVVKMKPIIFIYDACFSFWLVFANNCLANNHVHSQTTRCQVLTKGDKSEFHCPINGLPVLEPFERIRLNRECLRLDPSDCEELVNTAEFRRLLIHLSLTSWWFVVMYWAIAGRPNSWGNAASNKPHLFNLAQLWSRNWMIASTISMMKWTNKWL